MEAENYNDNATPGATLTKTSKCKNKLFFKIILPLLMNCLPSSSTKAFVNATENIDRSCSTTWSTTMTLQAKILTNLQ